MPQRKIHVEAVRLTSSASGIIKAGSNTVPSSSYNLTAHRIGHDLAFIELAPQDAGPSTPLVICLHGLRSEKENILKPCYHFARRGMRALAMDLRLHGERDHAGDLDRRLEDEYVRTMLSVIEKSVGDISALIDHFGAPKAAIHGISLGGVVAFSALLADPRLTVASIAMGNPDWGALLDAMGIPAEHPQYAIVHALSPLTRAAEIPPRALLMLHGDMDERVPIDGVLALRDKLLPLYAADPERMQLVIYEGLGHAYQDDMILRSVDWIERFL
jgi:pimeloyl-ACP methyl ester carboxylesterase